MTATPHELDAVPEEELEEDQFEDVALQDVALGSAQDDTLQDDERDALQESDDDALQEEEREFEENMRRARAQTPESSLDSPPRLPSMHLAAAEEEGGLPSSVPESAATPPSASSRFEGDDQSRRRNTLKKKALPVDEERAERPGMPLGVRGPDAQSLMRMCREARLEARERSRRRLAATYSSESTLLARLLRAMHASKLGSSDPAVWTFCSKVTEAGERVDTAQALHSICRTAKDATSKFRLCGTTENAQRSSASTRIMSSVQNFEEQRAEHQGKENMAATPLHPAQRARQTNLSSYTSPGVTHFARALPASPLFLRSPPVPSRRVSSDALSVRPKKRVRFEYAAFQRLATTSAANDPDGDDNDGEGGGGEYQDAPAVGPGRNVLERGTGSGFAALLQLKRQKKKGGRKKKSERGDWSKMILDPTSFAAVMRKCASLENQSLETDFRVMLRNIGEGGTCYIIPLIAACGLRYEICKVDFYDTIQQLGYLLCCPHDSSTQDTLSKDCGEIVRTLILPQMCWIKQMTVQLCKSFSIDFPTERQGEIENIPFSDVLKMRKKLREFDCSYFRLPQPDKCYLELENGLMVAKLPLSLEDFDVDESCVAEEVTIRTALKLDKTPCPVNPQNRELWTATERERAGVAYVATSVEDLREQLEVFHATGEKSGDKYICIPTEIMEGNVLTIRGANDELIVMLVTNIQETLPHLPKTALTVFSALYPEEIYSVNSLDEDYSYCALHKGYWNRYKEQGTGAPNIHPNNVAREGVTRRNGFHQGTHAFKRNQGRARRVGADRRIHQPRYYRDGDTYQKAVAQEYDHIRIWASRLPLNQRSAAYPFGGYVINLGVSTEGHRDEGDDLLCVTFWDGDSQGGELGMFEPGLLLRTRQWDATIFSSCKITHFNMPINGIRISLVLHSDKYGKNWVANQNNWDGE
ncbi:hypothetical protein B0H12DRAFT_1073020 [Mycena haematopus]|nr:hypothetical protein B0H12DRAFT_1073020 [Mycena haematopus]